MSRCAPTCPNLRQTAHRGLSLILLAVSLYAADEPKSVVKLTDKQRADYFKHRSAADNLARTIAQNEIIQTSLRGQLNEMERSLIQEQVNICGEKAKFEVTKEGEPECKPVK